MSRTNDPEEFSKSYDSPYQGFKSLGMKDKFFAIYKNKTEEMKRMNPDDLIALVKKKYNFD